MIFSSRKLIILILALSLCACATTQPPTTDFWGNLRQADGSVTWMDEINLVPPAAPWQILDLSETDFSLAFFKSCSGGEPGSFPCEATIAYAGEPFGYSQDLRKRQEEFFKRFLWASRLVFSEPQLSETTVAGNEALQADIVGEEPARGQHVKSRVIFIKRGERVEALFMNQWRAKDVPSDPSEFAAFEEFVSSFKYLKPSFYEQL